VVSYGNGRTRFIRARAGIPLFTALAILAGCGKSVTSAEDKHESPTAKAPSQGLVEFNRDAAKLRQIATEPVHTVAMPAEEITAPAKIEANPNRVGHALMPVPGRIVSVRVKLGDAVVQGQPLVSVDSPSISDAESAYTQSEAGVRQADVTLAKANADLARSKELFDHGALASKEVLVAEAAADMAKAAVEQAKAARDQSRQKLEHLGLKPGQAQQQVTVAAPISGKVLEINAVQGEYHNEINASLFTIADLSRVWVSSDVPESAIRFCHVGGQAELDLIAYPNETFRARVTRIADIVDPETRTVKVTAELDNPNGRLRPQMFGRLHYAGSTRPTIWVPEAAVVQVDGKDAVFVEEAPGRFRATPIQLGRRHNSGFAVLAGLASGQRVVTTGTVYVKAGL